MVRPPQCGGFRAGYPLYEMGMRMVRTLERIELMNMAHDAVRDGTPRDSLRSFV